MDYQRPDRYHARKVTGTTLVPLVQSGLLGLNGYLGRLGYGQDKINNNFGVRLALITILLWELFV